MPHFLETLNTPQREAVETINGPVMIIAGAGSGKTRVLTYRIAWLLENGVDPFHILALTFTNKAAQEMRERIEKVVGHQAKNIWMGTFHSVFSKILRIEGEKLGYPRDFTIYDTDDSRSLIKSIVKEMDLDDKIYKPSVVHNRISAAKNRLISWEDYLNDPIIQEDDVSAQRPKIGSIYKQYQARAFRSGAMDFDDLLFNTNVLLRDHPEVLNKYQQKFEHVMVDEYQDTNVSQYLITKKLSAVHQNICVVGDDAQSIYAFRGADISNILNFEKDYPELKTFRLEQNYRSTKNIVAAANDVIKNNKHQLKKNVWTDNTQGELIEVIKSSTDQEEANLIATTIFEERNNHSYNYTDFAVLYRTNAQSRQLEEAFRRRSIPYKIVGGLSFYQRKEVKDLLGWLRFVINPNDEEAFKRIINLPKRGIGESTINKLVVIAADNEVGIWEIAQAAQAALPQRSAVPVLSFVDMVRAFQVAEKKKDAYAIAQQIAKDTLILKELYDDKTVEGQARYANVMELLNGVKNFTDNEENEDKSLGAFLQQVALITDADDKDKDTNDKVTLMTIHGAKGLEFKSVFISGLEEDLFPSMVTLSSAADLEEERRLFYVAITRAEERLHMTYALTRYKYGMLKECKPSRFLDEVDTRYIKVNKKFNVEESQPVKFFDQFNLKKAPKPVAPPVKHSTHKASENFVPTDPKQLSEGKRVEHQKFGFGTIKALDFSTPDTRATVQFDREGEKTLILTFAKLMLVENN